MNNPLDYSPPSTSTTSNAFTVYTPIGTLTVKTSSNGAIIGGAVGGVVFLCICIMICCICCRKEASSEVHVVEIVEDYEDTNVATTQGPIIIPEESKPPPAMPPQYQGAPPPS